MTDHTPDNPPEEEDDRPLLFRVARPRPKTPLRVVPNPLPPSESGPYAQAALRREVEALARATEGTRNHQLNVAGFSLAQLVASGHLDHGAVYQALATTAIAVGLTEDETRKTLASSLGAGAQHPRQVAPLEATQAPEATGYPGPAKFTDCEKCGHPTDPTDPQPCEKGGQCRPAPPDPNAVEVPSIADRFPVLDWEELWADDTEEEWIVEPVLPARRLVALFSAPKVGKSLLMLELAVAIASGSPVLGDHPDPQVVLYVDFENDPRGDVRTRLQAMGKTPEDLGNLRYLSYPRLAKLDTAIGGLELLAVAQHHGATVVVIDTISRAVGGEENDNDTWLSFYRNTGLALKAAGITVIRLDHTGKDASKGMRGGSAKYGDVDAVWSLSRLTESTFRLECTDNRLPIWEKDLVLERHLDPLRHVVSTRRTGEVLGSEEDRIIALLDDLGVPPDTGRGKCEDALRAAGLDYTRNRMPAVVRTRKARHTSGDHPDQGRFPEAYRYED